MRLRPGRAFRLLGVGVSSFVEPSRLQLPLFDDLAKLDSSVRHPLNPDGPSS